jgi:hypothetical protein
LGRLGPEPDFYANWRELTPKLKQKQTKATKSETRHLVFYILKMSKNAMFTTMHVVTRLAAPERIAQRRVQHGAF